MHACVIPQTPLHGSTRKCGKKKFEKYKPVFIRLMLGDFDLKNNKKIPTS
jgi:hypothetical protein